MSIFASCNKFSSRNIDQSKNFNLWFFSEVLQISASHRRLPVLHSRQASSDLRLCFVLSVIRALTLATKWRSPPNTSPTGKFTSAKMQSKYQFPFVLRIKFADMIFPRRQASDFTLRMSGIVSFCGHAQFEGLNFPGQLINKRGNILGCIIAVGE